MADFSPCATLKRFLADPTVPIGYDAVLREFYLKRTEGTSVQSIYACPFCGGKLPSSLRDEFFDELEKRGFDYDSPDFRENLPPSFNSDAWWKELGL